MAIRVIPLSSDNASFTQRVDLDNTPYNLAFAWNDRQEVWHMSIADDTGEDLINGIPLFTKQDLLGKFRHDTRLPQGRVVLLNLVDEDMSPDRDNLGTDVLLTYEDAE